MPRRRREPAVLYVHGFTDYFFQEHLAEHFAARGHRFYALDLRKCGRSQRDGQTPHYISDWRSTTHELNEALRIVREETGGDVLIVAHSTGGLIVPLWLDRLQAAGGSAAAGIVGSGAQQSRGSTCRGRPTTAPVGTPVINAVGRFRALAAAAAGIRSPRTATACTPAARGEWDYNLDWKPLSGCTGARWAGCGPSAEDTRGCIEAWTIGVPALILRSRITKFAREHSPPSTWPMPCSM